MHSNNCLLRQELVHCQILSHTKHTMAKYQNTYPKMSTFHKIKLRGAQFHLPFLKRPFNENTLYHIKLKSCSVRVWD